MVIHQRGLLRNNVHVNVGGVGEEAVHGCQVEVLSPTPAGGPAKDDLRNFVLADKFGHRGGNNARLAICTTFAPRFSAKRLLAVERAVSIFCAAVISAFHMDDVKLRA